MFEGGKPTRSTAARNAGSCTDGIPRAIDVQKHEPGRARVEGLAKIVDGSIPIVQLRVCAGKIERRGVASSCAPFQRPQFEPAHSGGLDARVPVPPLRLGQHRLELLIRIALQRMALTACLDRIVKPLLRAADLGEAEVWHDHVRMRLDDGTAKRGCLLGLIRAQQIGSLVEDEHRTERIERARTTDDSEGPASVVERPPRQSVNEESLRLNVPVRRRPALLPFPLRRRPVPGPKEAPNRAAEVQIGKAQIERRGPRQAPVRLRPGLGWRHVILKSRVKVRPGEAHPRFRESRILVHGLLEQRARREVVVLRI